MPTIEFTDAAIRALRRPLKRTYYFDSKSRGLCLELHPSNHRTFMLYRRVDGKVTKRMIPEAANVEQARAELDKLNTKVGNWISAGKPTQSPFDPSPTELKYSELFEAYLSEYVRHSATKPDRAIAAARAVYNRGLSGLGSRKVVSIRRPEILKIWNQITDSGGPIMANRVVELFRRVLRWGIVERKHNADAKLLDGFHYHKEKSRKRFITPQEQPRFFKELARAKNRTLRDFLGILLYTGVRKSAVLSARWSEIEGDIWHIPADASKNGEPYDVVLSDIVLGIFDARRKTFAKSSEWVFPSPTKKGRHIVDVKQVWRDFRIKAGIPDVVLHDARRTFATMTLASGASVFLTSQALGHQNIASMKAYSRPEIESIRAAVEKGVALMQRNAKRKPRQLAAARA
jgi:integrase